MWQSKKRSAHKSLLCTQRIYRKIVALSRKLAKTRIHTAVWWPTGNGNNFEHHPAKSPQPHSKLSRIHFFGWNLLKKSLWKRPHPCQHLRACWAKTVTVVVKLTEHTQTQKEIAENMIWRLSSNMSWRRMVFLLLYQWGPLPSFWFCGPALAKSLESALLESSVCLRIYNLLSIACIAEIRSAKLCFQSSSGPVPVVRISLWLTENPFRN